LAHNKIPKQLKESDTPAVDFKPVSFDGPLIGSKIQPMFIGEDGKKIRAIARLCRLKLKIVEKGESSQMIFIQNQDMCKEELDARLDYAQKMCDIFINYLSKLLDYKSRNKTVTMELGTATDDECRMIIGSKDKSLRSQLSPLHVRVNVITHIIEGSDMKLVNVDLSSVENDNLEKAKEIVEKRFANIKNSLNTTF
jgi:hypothetical protein